MSDTPPVIGQDPWGADLNTYLAGLEAQVVAGGGTMLANRVKGAVSAGPPINLTPAQTRAVIASDSGGGTTNFFRADGTFAAPAGGGGTPADDSITNAKLADVAANTIKGAVSAGNPIDLTPTQARAVIASDSGSTTAYLRGDGTFAVPAGGGGGIAGVIIQEEDVTRAAAATTIDFGNGFDVAESPAGEANVALDLAEYTGSPLPQASVASLTTDLGNKQPLDPDLTDLASKWTAASSGAAASLVFSEATSGGTNKLTLGPTAGTWTADRFIGLPDSANTTLLGDNTVQSMTAKSINLTSNTLLTTLAQLNTAISDADVPAALNGLVAIWKGTQAQYDAIGTKDANTLYAIV